MSRTLFSKLAEINRRRKLQCLAKLDETQKTISRLAAKITEIEQARKQAQLSINQAMLHLTRQQMVKTHQVYDIRLLEAAMRRTILQMETEVDQCQKEKTRHESDAQELRRVVRYFGIKEEKMVRGEARSLKNSTRR